MQLTTHMRASAILAATGIALLTAATVWWMTSYDPSEFRGAAPMRDTGVFSNSRYHATLGNVPLASAGSYTLRFSGLPAASMVLQLYVAGGSDANRDLLQKLTTELRAEVVDSRGKVICSAIGTPSEAEPSRHWVLMSSLSQAAYWHDGCRNVAFARNTDYMLRLDIRNVDPRSPQVMLTATLEGGGIELS
jgi:hypothetical protein